VAGAVIAAVVAPIYLESSWITGILGTLIALAVALSPRYLKQNGITLPPLVGSCLAMATVAGICLSHLGPMMDRDGDFRRTGREMTAMLSDDSRPAIFYRTKVLLFPPLPEPFLSRNRQFLQASRWSGLPHPSRERAFPTSSQRLPQILRGRRTQSF